MKKSFKNRMKQALALVCLVWGMTLNVPIRAEETTPSTPTPTETVQEYTVTIGDGLDGHTFAAYQIIKGDVANGVLSNVEWGDGVNTTTLIGALKSKLGSVNINITESPDAKEIAEAIVNYTNVEDTTTKEQREGEIALLISHHLTSTKVTIDSINKTVSLVPGYYLIVDESGNTTNDPDFTWNESLLQLTGDMVIATKAETATIKKQVGETDSGGNVKYQDVADYSIGDTVPFQITSKVPETTHYDAYKYIFHDTLGTGLSLNENSIKVTVGERPLDANEYRIETNLNGNIIQDGCSLHVEVPGLKGHDNEVVKVEYNARLNEQAAVGITSDQKNVNAVRLDYTNHPYSDSSYASTPQDKVLVLTYKLVGTKMETGTETTLPDAEFYLLNSQNETGNGYAKITDGKFAGWGTIGEAGKLTSNENGTFEIQGLDAGTYYLKEIKAPTGYNIMEEPQEVQLIANKSETYEFGEGQSPIQFNTNDDGSNSSNKSVDNTGTLNVTVFNGKGFTMPSTGAFGQTLIYSVGGLMALSGLGIRLARRRHEKE